jgi:transposase-like protein
MGRKRVESATGCPHCGSTWVRRNGSSRGKPRWQCGDCGKTVGGTFGTAMYRLHTSVEEVARTLLIVMRRGSLRGAEEISGHKWETIRGWLLRASMHAEALTASLVKDLELDEVEVDAFWSFVGNAIQALRTGQVRHGTWALANPRKAASPGEPASRGPGRTEKASRKRAARAGAA